MIDRAERLRYAMELCGISAAELSRKSGFSKSSISQYLSGLHAPTKGGTEMLADALGVSPAWLFGFDVPMNCSYTGEHTQRNEKQDPGSTKFIRIGTKAVNINHIVVITYWGDGIADVLLDTGQKLEGKIEKLESIIIEDFGKDVKKGERP